MPPQAKRVFRTEIELKDLMVSVMEAELRLKLLTTLMREGLATKEVAKFVKNQIKTRKVRKLNDYTEMVKCRMLEKVNDSKTDANTLRNKRKEKRKELENLVEPRKYANIVKKLETKKNKRKEMIQSKNKLKIVEYRNEQRENQINNLVSSHVEYPDQYKELRIFKGEEIKPEPLKPQVVASKDLTLDEDEILILSKGPKFTLRNILDRQTYLEELEKSFIKEKYNRIGKEETDGIVVEESEDEDSAWLEKKLSMIYDFEDKTVDFGRSKPTGWKNNKRVNLPKTGSTQLEGFIEVRRRDAIRVYDECLKVLGYDEKKDKDAIDNLNAREKKGLRSLQKRVKSGELIVCQTDKSSRFCVMSRDDYIKAGEVHTNADREVDIEEAEEIQRILNGHMRWWSKILNLGGNWDQEDRALRNTLNNGLAICPMTIMIKDHKTWSLESGEPPPSRNIMNGKLGMNMNMSEFISLALEPIANEDKESMETNATDGLVADIEKVNRKWATNQKEDHNIPEGWKAGPEGEKHEESVPKGWKQEGPADENISKGWKSGSESWKHEDGSIPQGWKPEPENIPGGWKEQPGQDGPGGEASHTLTSYEDSSANSKKEIKKDDIRFYITRDGTNNTLHCDTQSCHQDDTKKESRMNLLRRKFTECRKRKERQETKNITVIKAPQTWKGVKLKSARESSQVDVQEVFAPVIIGADVKALYPSLSDLDTAIICFNAIMDTDIHFTNINYKLASKYIAICMTDEEQRTSGIRDILPKRTTKNGVKPGVTSKPENDENWRFPIKEPTDLQKKTIFATMVMIGVLEMMNSHLYQFNNKIYLQQAGGPIGLRATCAVARIVMNFWDKKWKEKMEDNNIKRDLEDRYMDDIRVILMAIKEGWRWHQEGLYWCKEWEEEDKMKEESQETRTSRLILESMNSVLDFLTFTEESPSDFEDNKLPTLDIKIWIARGKIWYQFFQKPMSNNVVIQERSALSDQVKVSSLQEEVVRRLKHTNSDLPNQDRIDVLEDLSQRMVNSGHKPFFIKRVLVTGISKYERKLQQSKLDPDDKNFKHLHQPSERCK